MAIHHFGMIEENIPPRPILSKLSFKLRQSNLINNKEVKSAFEEFLKSDYDKSSSVKFLDRIGRFLSSEEKKIFGSSLLLPTKRGNPPLVITGDLRNKTAHKNSIDNVVKT